jgi:hypothetical protein
MKLIAPHSRTRSRRDESGFLVVTLMVILTILLLYVTVGLRALNHLNQDLKFVERKQVQHWQTISARAVSTNAPPATP